MAKPAEEPYVEDKRAQLKVKHKRTADCVVAGYRTHKDGEGVGSLLLGVYDDDGELHHLGVAAVVPGRAAQGAHRRAGPVRDGRADRPPVARVGRRGGPRGGRAACPACQNRWTGAKDQSWTPLRLELVAEVTYDGLHSGRLRHTARFVRWRPDKTPTECRYDQLDHPTPAELAADLRPKLD